ncbi:uncharacterized protein PGTG_19112 [Puccinia graminis f. sp. tritici CRL 75-36-700-3]|uniref:mRNA export factor GLE1 n=1 Tax=Puccinia graminis f. sp. tritici (strain CRL 75-36-700-3 / race SCCL) TaxID=418459 RepID=E3L9C7_PUCGT|nr:uncharacterized protein PGTG_19112 [Puccinia graminis f. sp. tritici CRL 75-36-700-3]EFP93152.2 hypothetical protein PGTG_19112 [Puccinia graminis f. sp. tritici CRL 75-36-700-3]
MLHSGQGGLHRELQMGVGLANSNHQTLEDWKSKAPTTFSSANLGLPVPTSDTTPSPFAVVPHNLKSSTSGFPINRSSLRIRLDEQTSFSSDEGEEEDEQPDSEEEQWPIKRCDPGAPSKALESFNVPHLLPDDDPVLVWEQQERQSTYQLSIQNATARRRHFEGIHVRTLARANENSEQQHKQQMNDLSKVLARIGLNKERQMRLAELERQELLKQQQLEERKEAETKRKLEHEHQDLLERQKKEAKELKLSEAQASTIKSVRDDYKKSYSTIQQFKSSVLPTVSASESFKTLCRQAKRRITPKESQLTNGSRQIEKVILEVGGVLNETRKHDESVYLWVCNHLAKAGTEVTAKLSTVYPLGRLVVGLMMIGYPEVGTILMGRLVKKCYFLVAYRPIPEEGQSEADYRKQLGYQSESSTIKQSDPSDVVPSLKGVPKQEQLQRIPPELRLDSSWKWLANTLKLPLIFLTATPRVLASFLEVASQRLFEIYGSQFIKFLKTLLDRGILIPAHPSLKFNWNDIDCKPSIFQLQGLIEDFLNKGKLLPDPHLNPTGQFYQLTYD